MHAICLKGLELGHTIRGRYLDGMGNANDLASLLSRFEDVLGVGVDVEEIDRFRSVASPRIFSRAEREFCAGAADPAECLAGRWCAKEAVVKALASQIQLGLRDVEIWATDSGRPIVSVPERVDAAGLTVEVSISHTTGIAVAVAVLRAKTRR